MTLNVWEQFETNRSCATKYNAANTQIQCATKYNTANTQIHYVHFSHQVFVKKKHFWQSCYAKVGIINKQTRLRAWFVDDYSLRS